MYAQVDRIGQGVPETQEQASTTETQGSPSTGLPAHPSTPPPLPPPAVGFWGKLQIMSFHLQLLHDYHTSSAFSFLILPFFTQSVGVRICVWSTHSNVLLNRVIFDVVLPSLPLPPLKSPSPSPSDLSFRKELGLCFSQVSHVWLH